MLYGMVRKRKSGQIRKLRPIEEFDLHQSNWGYNKQFKWFEEQIWGLK